MMRWHIIGLLFIFGCGLPEATPLDVTVVEDEAAAKRRALLQARQRQARDEVNAREPGERDAGHARMVDILQANGVGRPAGERVLESARGLPEKLLGPYSLRTEGDDTSADANAYSDSRGAGASVVAGNGGRATAAAPIPRITVWRPMRYYRQGYRFRPYGQTHWQDHKTVSYRYAVLGDPEHLNIETQSEASGEARAGAEVRRQFVMAFAETKKGGAAHAHATVRPKPGHPVFHGEGDRVRLCNDLPAGQPLNVVIAFRRRTERTNAWRQSNGPLTVVPGACTGWYPSLDLSEYDVFVRAQADWTDSDGRHRRVWGDGPKIFCAVDDILNGPMSRWWGYGEPEDCGQGLAALAFTQVAPDRHEAQDGGTIVEVRLSKDNASN